MLVQSRINQVEGDQGVAMGIDAASVAHIQGILANMYSNPHGAVAREYIANAADSHRLAGQTRPIEVSSVSDPFGAGYSFIVQDFGVGMSREEVEKHYAQYGASSKRDSAGQIGGFGIGCKSALAVASGFTVTAVKAGEVTTAAFTLGEDGGGNYSVLHHEVESAEPNGVRVEVTFDSQRDLWLVQAASENMLHYWPAGELRVDGALSDASELQGTDGAPDGIAWGAAAHYGLAGRIALVLGGIRYNVPDDAVEKVRSRVTDKIIAGGPRHLDFIRLWLDRYTGRQVYILAGPSDVDLPPNRETVMATNRTIDWIVDRLEALSEHMFGEFSEQIESATDLREAYTFAKKMWDACSRLGVDAAEHNSPRWGAMSTEARLPVGATIREIGADKVRTLTLSRINIDSPIRWAVYVHASISSHQSRALRFWALENNVQYVVTLPTRKHEDAWLVFDADDPDASTVEVGDFEKILAEGKALIPKSERRKAGKVEFSVGVVGADRFEDITPMTFEDAQKLASAEGSILYYSPTPTHHYPGMAEGSIVIWGDGTQRSANALQRRVDKTDGVEHIQSLRDAAVAAAREDADLREKLVREYVRRTYVWGYGGNTTGVTGVLRGLEHLRPLITHEGVLKFWDALKPADADGVVNRMWMLRAIDGDTITDDIEEARKEFTPPADIAPLLGVLADWEGGYRRSSPGAASDKVIVDYINSHGILY